MELGPADPRSGLSGVTTPTRPKCPMGEAPHMPTGPPAGPPSELPGAHMPAGAPIAPPSGPPSALSGAHRLPAPHGTPRSDPAPSSDSRSSCSVGAGRESSRLSSSESWRPASRLSCTSSSQAAWSAALLAWLAKEARNGSGRPPPRPPDGSGVRKEGWAGSRIQVGLGVNCDGGGAWASMGEFPVDPGSVTMDSGARALDPGSGNVNCPGPLGDVPGRLATTLGRELASCCREARSWPGAGGGVG